MRYMTSVDIEAQKLSAVCLALCRLGLSPRRVRARLDRGPVSVGFPRTHKDTPISRLSAVARLVIWWVSQNSLPRACNGVLRWRLQRAVHRADFRRRFSGERQLRRRRGRVRAAGAAAKWRSGLSGRRKFGGHRRESVRRPNDHRGPRPRWWSHRRGQWLRRGGDTRGGESPQIPPGGAAVCCVAHSQFSGRNKVQESQSTCCST